MNVVRPRKNSLIWALLVTALDCIEKKSGLQDKFGVSRFWVRCSDKSRMGTSWLKKNRSATNGDYRLNRPSLEIQQD